MGGEEEEEEEGKQGAREEEITVSWKDLRMEETSCIV